MNYRKIGAGLGAFAAGSAAVLLGRRVKGSFYRLDGEATSPDTPEHVPTDLAAGRDVHAGRAIDAFRPDPTAPVPPELREALRPATGPAPTLVANEGETVTEAVGVG